MRDMPGPGHPEAPVHVWDRRGRRSPEGLFERVLDLPRPFLRDLQIGGRDRRHAGGRGPLRPCCKIP
jgi:hypothetical protein